MQTRYLFTKHKLYHYHKPFFLTSPFCLFSQVVSCTCVVFNFVLQSLFLYYHYFSESISVSGETLCYHLFHVRYLGLFLVNWSPVMSMFCSIFPLDGRSKILIINLHLLKCVSLSAVYVLWNSFVNFTHASLLFSLFNSYMFLCCLCSVWISSMMPHL